jgi:acyl carrier protein
MHFGENVREIVSLSCGRDLRSARSRTPLPGIDSPDVQKRLAANLERSFDISLSPEDISHLTTVRAVLQCVRLRRWERETMNAAPDRLVASTTAAAEPTPAPSLRERLVRYSPPTSSVPMPAAASFAARKS